jgi:hypothetical protein
MRFFAKIEDDQLVSRVITISDETIDPIAFIADELGLLGTWLETWESGGGRKTFASAGMTYSAALDAFIPSRPFGSWILNESTAQWEAPIACPENGLVYYWNEEALDWTECVEPEIKEIVEEENA